MKKSFEFNQGSPSIWTCCPPWLSKRLQFHTSTANLVLLSVTKILVRTSRGEIPSCAPGTRGGAEAQIQQSHWMLFASTVLSWGSQNSGHIWEGSAAMRAATRHCAASRTLLAACCPRKWNKTCINQGSEGKTEPGGSHPGLTLALRTTWWFWAKEGVN